MQKSSEVVLPSLPGASSCQPQNPSRRNFGKLLGLASVVPLAGCLGGGGGGDDGADGDTGTTPSTSYAISSDAKVSVTGGVIQGTNMSTGVRSFLGVPFAAPPVGSLRWKAPQPVVAWSGTKATQTNPPAAIKQSAPLILPGATTPYPASEDCLYLNIWVPKDATASKGGLPVMVWLHGGGANIVEQRSAGDELAKKGLIYINAARRQSIFANFAHAGLSAEVENKGSSGNFETLDMIAALQWVQNNIAKFGGDPNNVTLGAQSQGTVFAAMLQATPLAKGLFKRVFYEAGYMFKGTTARTTGKSLATAEADGAAWMAKFGTVTGTTAATTVADMRAKTTDELYLIAASFSTEIIDNYVFSDTVTNTFIDKKETQVSGVYGGYNLLDTGVAPTTVTDTATYNAYLSTKFGANAATVFSLYPAFNSTDAVAQATRIVNDSSIGQRNVAQARLQALVNTPTFLYRLDRGGPLSPNGSKHGWDINYWHGKMSVVNNDSTLPYQTAADYELSNIMVDSLISFCTSGNPSTSAVTVPQYFQSDEKITVFDVGSIAAIPVPLGIDWFVDNATTF